ncbi:hypothetical protein EVAR_9668_1 [Eumeta japonica]|uniref:Uncharacterized protein n=1 Tax=Eumeta variegata TaxID=151549 RepID=A0A4C1TL46_EUMVA|nr:hypothetical protein EVAR_9668_1 [Eumeta japonica]
MKVHHLYSNFILKYKFQAERLCTEITHNIENAITITKSNYLTNKMPKSSLAAIPSPLFGASYSDSFNSKDFNRGNAAREIVLPQFLKFQQAQGAARAHAARRLS